MKKTALLGLVVVLAAGMALATETKHKEFVGNVASIDREARTVVVENSTGSRTFALDSYVTIREETGKTIALGRLNTGDHVKIVYIESDGKLMASKLERLSVKAASTSPMKKN